jgi:hypothetical protein
MAGYKRHVSRGTIKYVDAGISAGPRSTFHDSADFASQKAASQGNTKFTVSALEMYG